MSYSQNAAGVSLYGAGACDDHYAQNNLPYPNWGCDCEVWSWELCSACDYRGCYSWVKNAHEKNSGTYGEGVCDTPKFARNALSYPNWGCDCVLSEFDYCRSCDSDGCRDCIDNAINLYRPDGCECDVPHYDDDYSDNTCDC